MQFLRKALRGERREIQNYLNNSQVRSYYLAVIASSFTVWTLAFNFGAYETIFFRTLFSVWVLSTVVFLATLSLPPHEHPLGRGQLAVLLLPTLWMISFVFMPAPGESVDPTFRTISDILGLITIISIPNLGYAILIITQGEVLRLPRRMLGSLITIVIAVAIAGYFVGSNHEFFVTCDEFTVAGDFAPPDCYDGS